MRHFIAYHNAKNMGYSCTAIRNPQIMTGNPVKDLEGVTVWIVAGEGDSPKSYYLAARFIAAKCEPNLFPETALPHSVSGPGTLYGLSKPIGGTPLLASIRKQSANFVRGFHETSDLAVIGQLIALI
jgi:hypothetical protein